MLALLAVVVGLFGVSQLVRAAVAWGDPGWEFAPQVWALVGLAALMLAGLLLMLAVAAVRGSRLEATVSIAAGSLVALMLGEWLAGNRSDSFVFFMLAAAMLVTSDVLWAGAEILMRRSSPLR